MAKALKSEQVITIDGSNTIYGGNIFDVSVQIGFKEDPTSITVLVLSEDGSYNINSSFLNTNSPSIIKIGSKLTINPCFLYSYKIIYQEDARVLQLEYKDGSILLDKIFVALHWTDSNVGELSFTDSFDIPFSCGPKNSYEAYNGINNFYEESVVQKSFYAAYSNFSLWDGGFINIGFSEFRSNECSIPEYKYHFNSLLNLIESNGLIKLKNKPQNINIYYSADYRGTLREVLNNWCSDYGLSYYWNSVYLSTDAVSDVGADIVFVDLKNPVSFSKIEQVKAALTSFQKTQKSVVSRYEESYSLDGTYRQYNVSRFDIEPRDKSSTISNYYPIELSSISPSEIIKRNIDITSACLGQYDKRLRDLYNYRKGYYKSLGFRSVLPLGEFSIDSDESIGTILYVELDGSTTQSVQSLMQSAAGAWSRSSTEGGSNFYATYPLTSGTPLKNKTFKAKIHLGVYDPSIEYLANVLEDFAVNSLGKYYLLGEQKYDGINYCDSWKSFNVNSQYFPELSNIKNTADIDLPSYLKLGGLNSGIVNNQGDALFVRQSAFGTEEEEFNEITSSSKATTYVTTEYDNILELIAPQLIKLNIEEFDPEVYEQNVGGEDNQAIISINSGISEWMDRLKNIKGLTPCILIGPSDSDCDNFLSVTAGGNVVNQVELENYKNEQSQNSTDVNTECESACSKDVVENLCDQYQPSDGESYNSAPYVGLKSFYASSINVRLRNADSYRYVYDQNRSNFPATVEPPKAGYTRTIVLPCQSNYLGYRAQTTTITEHYPAYRTIYGNIGGAGNTASIRVNNYDMSSDLPPIFQQDGAEITKTIRNTNSGWFYTSPETLHTLNDQNLGEGVADPLASISVSLAGFDFQGIEEYLKPENGLLSMNVNFREDGSYVDLEFSSRPREQESFDIKFSKLGLTSQNAKYL